MRQLKITNKITSRESMSLDKYLSDISKIDMLTPEEETELAKKIREGDEAAFARMVNANLRFVVSVAKQYQNQGLTLSDLINEGNVGLMKACTRFDETKGFKFISYAVWWIRQSILQAIVEHSRLVRLPLNKVSAYNKVNESYQRFLQEFEREPSTEELADMLDITPSEVTNVLKGGNRHVSFDAPVGGDEGDSTILDLFQSEDNDLPDNELIENSLNVELEAGLQSLSSRERKVLVAYYGLNEQGRSLTLEEIGDLYGLTRERVRQIKERAIRRLRKSTNRNKLKSYL